MVFFWRFPDTDLIDKRKINVLYIRHYSENHGYNIFPTIPKYLCLLFKFNSYSLYVIHGQNPSDPHDMFPTENIYRNSS